MCDSTHALLRFKQSTSSPNLGPNTCTLPVKCVSVSIGKAPDKVCVFISIMFISSLIPTFCHLLESSHQNDSKKWSNIRCFKK